MIEIYRTINGWRWRVKDAHGQIKVESGYYLTKSEAVTNFQQVQMIMKEPWEYRSQPLTPFRVFLGD